MKLTARQFDQATRASRLEDTSIVAGRAVLVAGRAAADVAREHGMTRQRVHAIAKQILALHQEAAAVKVTAAEFMAARPRREDLLAPFVRELRRLASNGRSPDEMRAYLAANDVKASAEEIESVLGARKDRTDENGGLSEPKGRRRQDR